MWRALAVFVGLLLAVGTFAAVAGDLSGPTRPGMGDGAQTSSLGFALAAGAIALAATMLMQRPRRRFR